MHVALEADPVLTVRGARGAHASSDFVFVRVVTDTDISGFGEVSAVALWSGEDAVTATHLIRNVLRPALVGRPLAGIPALVAGLDRVLAGNPFTKAGVSMALWDALGRLTGLRVCELLGGPFRESVPVRMLLSGNGDVLAACYEAARARGFRSFKVKVGLDVAGDLERFSLARSLAGESTFLGSDANGGWTRSQARQAIPRLRELGAAFIEQPVAPGDVEGLHQEPRPADARRRVRFLARGCHPGDSGRCRRLREHLCRQERWPEKAVLAIRTLGLFGIDALVGSNGEMGLGAAAQIHVACACERIAEIPSDIIGHHYYNQEILVSPVPIDGSMLFCPRARVLAWSLRRNWSGSFHSEERKPDDHGSRSAKCR